MITLIKPYLVAFEYVSAPVFSSFALELLEGNRLAVRAGRPGGYLQAESGHDGEGQALGVVCAYVAESSGQGGEVDV